MPAASNDAELKISVIVAVYNPGSSLGLPVDSFRRQTMPATDFEAIFVDDGSTDGSGRRLDRLARRLANFSAIHIPNSGWPGRPRNLGIEAAKGRYVLFVDHDDWLADDALERLWEAAESNGADVVAPREIGHGFGVPRRMFRRNIPDAKLGQDDILALLTPHKLFRRSMLVEHDIRFPEGPCRLEDHHFVIQTYFAARRITILADHAAYHWAKRDEGGNATGASFSRTMYYANLRDILDIVDRNTEPGWFRDRLYAHWLRYKMIHKLLRPRFRTPGRDARALYGEVRALMLDRFEAQVDAHLPVGYRLVARAVRADRLDLVVAAAHVANGLRLDLDLTGLTHTDHRIELDVEYALRDPDGAPLRLERRDDRLLWRPPVAMIDGLDLEPANLDCTDEMPATELALVVRQRGTDVHHDAPIPLPMRPSGSGAAEELAARVTLELDPSTFAAGAPLTDGTWDVLVQAEFGGFRASRRMLGRQLPARDSDRPSRVHPYTTARGDLALQVGEGRPPPPALAIRRAMARTPLGGLTDRARSLARRVVPPSARAAIRRLLQQPRHN